MLRSQASDFFREVGLLDTHSQSMTEKIDEHVSMTDAVDDVEDDIDYDAGTVTSRAKKVIHTQCYASFRLSHTSCVDVAHNSTRPT
jgi:hypothetical protein